MKYLLKYILCCCLLASMAACSKGTDETVESAYLLPLLPELSYKFSRNGESSVNLLECQFLKTPIDRVFSEFMTGANMGSQTNYDEALKLYHEGGFGLKPREEIAASPTQLQNREQIVKDVDDWLIATAYISGLGTPNPYEHKNRETKKGKSGYVANSADDNNNMCFVNEKGVALAEVYKYAMLGAVYLDKIVNKHLNVELLKDMDMLSRHSQTQLLSGHNYTELEHHWDLAYGYYGFWKSLAQSEGLPALKGSDLRIVQAFVKGRTFMATSRYNEMRLQADTIRQELSRVIGVRTMHFLVGENTIANLKESPQSAFRLLSGAWGMLYATQFACDAQGQPIITYEETRALLNALETHGGLWDKERLLGDEGKEGSLRNIAARVGKKIGISPEEIRK